MLTLGIDEAGKGPVVGSLFIAGALFKEEDLEKLKILGIKDSKLLIHSKRIKLCKEIKDLAVKVKVIRVEPVEIDNALDSPDLNLNWLEALKQVEIINELKPDRVVIDCPSPNIKAYKEYLQERLTHKPIIICEHKADQNFIECSSASIVAKCHREEEVEKIEKKYGPVGSGYMSNPICQEFLKNNWEIHPEIFRHSWTPYKNHKNNKHQKALTDFNPKSI